jgi:hypothetical protein
MTVKLESRIHKQHIKIIHYRIHQVMIYTQTMMQAKSKFVCQLLLPPQTPDVAEIRYGDQTQEWKEGHS